jgi:hypothetical protein
MLYYVYNDSHKMRNKPTRNKERKEEIRVGGGLLPTTLFVLQAGRVLTLLNSLYAAYFRKWLSECLPLPSPTPIRTGNWNEKMRYKQPGPLVVIDQLECQFLLQHESSILGKDGVL